MGVDCEPLASQVHRRRIVAHGLSRQVILTDFSCRACRHPPGAEEFNEDPSVVFVRRGVFMRRQDGDSLVADSSRILFFNPRHPYRISHPVDGGDDCTIMTVALPLALEIVARHAPRAAERAVQCPFPGTSAPADRNLWIGHYELLTHAASRPGLETDDLLLDLLETIVRASQAEVRRHRRRALARVRCRTAARHRDLVQAAIVAIRRDLADPPGLGRLAGALGCSAFHLSRVFREVAGCSMREFLATARTRAAADAIARGALSLTDVALELGYVDHSHLTRAFRKEWSITPSEFRGRAKRISAHRGTRS